MTARYFLGAYVLPRCPVHGQMQYRFALDKWTCAGYDGEGCDYEVTSEELES